MTEKTDISMKNPPIAVKKDHYIEHHDIRVEDPYHWMRDAGYPVIEDEEILTHLKRENQWYEHNIAGQKGLTKNLFAEMKGRIKEADKSVPQKDGDWLYWVEYEEGAQYKKWYRQAVSGGDAILILDETQLAKGKEYFRLGAFSISPDGTLLAFAVDDNGSERFEVRIKNLTTEEMLPDVIPGTLSSLVWNASGTELLYCLANDQWRTDNVHIHILGTSSDQDIEIYHEDDEGFRVGVSLTSSEKYILVSAGDHETSEVYMLPADNPRAKAKLVRARKKGREYDVEHHGDALYILTNDEHINFRLAKAHVDTPDQWETVIAGSNEFYLTDMTAFEKFYVLEGRERGLDQIEIRAYDGDDVHRIALPESSYSAGLSDNPEYDVDVLRLSYESMVTPSTVFDYHLSKRRFETLKVQEIPSGYDAGQYVTQRLTIAARDGTDVPVSLVRHKDTPADGTAPLHLYGYGAYGITIDPGFSTTRLSLIDRGFIYAIAHIRGGDDLGRQWYLDGKLEKRTNTFNDFIDVARALVSKGYTSEGKITASGGSAGGELMGAIINDAPELWGAVVAHVPFVDVLNTMLDDSLPLTPGEWPEWGNPIEDKAAFELIRSYSPYDQVKRQGYPPMLVTAGLNDPRVTYWEPAKWVAKLREYKTDDNILLLKTNMGAGHGGKSGRWDSLEETAEEYAFILWQMGMDDMQE